MPRPARTLIEVCISRAGWRRGMRISTFIVCWAIATRDTGAPLSVDEYAKWWREPRSTAFRWLDEFREVFPDEENPQRLAEGINARVVDATDGPTIPAQSLGLA